ncbi:MAG TPA: tripartite tricarboxylate transporter substrate-binding protein [Xanthobacteraceae bacterium]|nr:tripartite tricarboxylate transporter substrate-binding protein [Xanthobacteraceae bacterium]
MSRRAFLTGAAALGLGAAVRKPVRAQTSPPQTFPSGALRYVVPASVSTPPDILARIVANGIAENEGWNIIVEDKPGAVMTLGAGEVLKQPADGQTLFAAMMGVTAISALVPTASINIETDFAPVVRVGTAYNVLVVNPGVPVRSIAELIAFLEKSPDKHTYSSGGFATPAHLLGELFKLETGVRATHVPYTQFPQAIADLISGVNTYQFIGILPVVQLINTGKLRALAVMGKERNPALPDVPTIVEAGFPKLVSGDWAGIMVKAGTPRDVIARLNRAVNYALKTDKVLTAFARIGIDVGGGTPESFGALVHAETVRWTKVIKDAGIKINT